MRVVFQIIVIFSGRSGNAKFQVKSFLVEAELWNFKSQRLYSLCGSRTRELQVTVYSLYRSGTVEPQVTVYSCAEAELQVTEHSVCRSRTAELEVTEYSICGNGTSNHSMFLVQKELRNFKSQKILCAELRNFCLQVT